MMPGTLDCAFECVLDLPRRSAFELVVDRPGLWWRSPFEAMQEGLAPEVGIEPFPGGVCYEIDPRGRRRIWGTVLSIEEPIYVRLSWQIGPDGSEVADPGAASRVMISFRDAGECTRLEILHGEFLRHGEDGPRYLERMRGPDGWPTLIARLQAAAANFKAR